MDESKDYEPRESSQGRRVGDLQVYERLSALEKFEQFVNKSLSQKDTDSADMRRSNSDMKSDFDRRFRSLESGASDNHIKLTELVIEKVGQVRKEFESRSDNLEKMVDDNHKELTALVATKVDAVKEGVTKELDNVRIEVKADGEARGKSIMAGQDRLADTVTKLGDTVKDAQGFQRGVVWAFGGLVTLAGGLAWIVEHREIIVAVFK